jgi:hypothetical protein
MGHAAVAIVSAPLPVPAEKDRDAFARTACYAAGRCQGDLCCPVRSRCRRVPDEERDDYRDG